MKNNLLSEIKFLFLFHFRVNMTQTCLWRFWWDWTLYRSTKTEKHTGIQRNSMNTNTQQMMMFGPSGLSVCRWRAGPMLEVCVCFRRMKRVSDLLTTQIYRSQSVTTLAVKLYGRNQSCWNPPDLWGAAQAYIQLFKGKNRPIRSIIFFYLFFMNNVSKNKLI